MHPNPIAYHITPEYTYQRYLVLLETEHLTELQEIRKDPQPVLILQKKNLIKLSTVIENLKQSS